MSQLYDCTHMSPEALKTEMAFDLKNDAATRAFGARLSAYLNAGDTLCLTGDLGAGKTTLSRGLIRSLSPKTTEVPSPTYTLLQTYSAPDFDIWHFDLYRLKTPSEIWELGMEDAIYDGLTLIEWPEQMGNLLPDGTLDIDIRFAGAGRKALLSLTPAWKARLHDL